MYIKPTFRMALLATAFGGLITAPLYNLVAKVVGGVEIELS